MKYIFLRLRDRVGEQEFYTDSVSEVEDDTDIDEWAKQQARESWAKEEYDEETDDFHTVYSASMPGFDENVFFSPSWEVTTKVISVKEISKEHYDILSRYI